MLIARSYATHPCEPCQGRDTAALNRQVRYAGYLKRSRDEAERAKKMEESPPIEANGNDPQKGKKFPIESQGVQPNKTKRRMRLKSVKYGFRSELFGINGPNGDKRHEKQGRIERYAPHFVF